MTNNPNAFVSVPREVLISVRQFLNDSGPDDDPEWRFAVGPLLAIIETALAAAPSAPVVSGEEELRKALEPFAAMADEYDFEPEETQDRVSVAHSHNSNGPSIRITVGDLRRARAALKQGGDRG